MKFLVSSTRLLKNLQTVGSVIGNNNTLPILDNFLFDLSLNTLKVIASDLQTTITAEVEVEATEAAKIAVPAKLFLEILKTFPEQPITIYTKKENVLEIVSEQGKYEVAFNSADQFPVAEEIENPTSFSIQGQTIAEGITKALFATSNDELRPIMTGVYFQFGENGCNFVATDAHKLVKYSQSKVKFDATAEFVMPKKPLNLLKSTLSNSESEVDVQYNNTNAKFSYDNYQIICRLIDGKYPNYEGVIPKNNDNILTINRLDLLSSAKRVAIFANKTNHLIRFDLKGNELNLSAEDIDFSSKANERLICDYQGTDLVIGFNSKFLIEMLNNLNSEEVRLEMDDATRAGLLFPADNLEEGQDILMLLMPLMVK